MFGQQAGFGVGLLLLLGLLIHQWINVHRLVAWTRRPPGTALPRAKGVWNFVFADLGRRARLSYSQQERLASALERFREASQAMPDGVLYLSEGFEIEWVNRQGELHFGLDARRDTGVPLTHLVRQAELTRYLEMGRYAEPLIFQPSRAGRLTLQVQLIPLGDERKMLISRDVSQLEKLEVMRRDFVANVSHELRTPLTVVAGFLETLQDGLDSLSREEMDRYLTMALEQSGRMRRLIEDLLTLARLETDAPPPLEERVDMVELLADIHHETELLSAERHQVSLHLESRCDLIGNAKELHSAFANLTSNAVRYTPEGGAVRIRWRETARGGEFSVEDTGIGIDAQHLPRLTERFYRVDRGRSRETGGTGLGLAIVKHILTHHQAELLIDSEPGKGSCFTVVFPRSRLRMPAA